VNIIVDADVALYTDEIVDKIGGVPGRVLAAIAHSRLSDEIVNEINGVSGRVLAAVAHIITFCRICRRNIIYRVGVRETVLRPRSRRR
jgi:hypothetical protein